MADKITMDDIDKQILEIINPPNPQEVLKKVLEQRRRPVPPQQEL